MLCASALEATIALNLRSQVTEPQSEAAVARNCAERARSVPQAPGGSLDDAQSVANLEATGAQAAHGFPQDAMK
jgi:hypothetical protein